MPDFTARAGGRLPPPSRSILQVIDAEGRRAAELIGRTAESERIARALATACADAVPVVIEIEGDAGIGKSTLLEDASARSRLDGFVVAVAACYAVQAQIPLSALRKLLDALLEALGEDRSRYTTGLERILESPKPESAAQALTRLVEGVTLDRPVLLALDDAQWSDDDSLQLLGELVVASIDRPVAVLVAKRTLAETAFLKPDITITLHPLDDEGASAVTRRLLPAASPEIVAAIISHARGFPLDIVALSATISEIETPSADDVASSRRNAIARDVQAASPELREFLQICSLLDGPVSYRLLERLWPDPQKVDDLVTRSFGRYLVSSGNAVRFVHALIAEGVRETIAIPAPYRRRIIAGLRELDNLSPEDFEALAGQLAASGDKSGAHGTLAKLAADAAHRGDIRLTASASRRALQFSTPPVEMAPGFFTSYADALFAIDQNAEAGFVLENALRLLHDAKSALPGAAIARLIIAQSFSDQLGAAKRTYDRFVTEPDPIERSHVVSAGLWFAVCDGDRERSRAVLEEFATLGDRLPFLPRQRVLNFSALIEELAGDHQSASDMLDRAESVVKESTFLGARGIALSQLAIPRLLVGLWEFGTRAIDAFLEARITQDGSSDTTLDCYFRALRCFLTESWDAADAAVASGLDLAPGRTSLCRILGVSAGMAALQARNSPHQAAIEGEIAHFLNGQTEGWSATLAAWWAAQTASAEPKTASIVLGRLMDIAQTKSDPVAHMPEIALVIAANRLGDGNALRKLKTSPTKRNSPWHRAHSDAARLLAAKLVGASAENHQPTSAECRRLGIPLIADILSSAFEGRQTAGALRLADLGVAPFDRKTSPLQPDDPRKRPTPRELQVAEQVALGKTNQEIAEALVVSQRTVEAHLGNLFNKLDVSSRTQLTAWFLTRNSAS